MKSKKGAHPLINVLKEEIACSKYVLVKNTVNYQFPHYLQICYKLSYFKQFCILL